MAHVDPIKVARGKGGRFIPENPKEELPPPILTDNKKEDKEGTDGGGSEV